MYSMATAKGHRLGGDWTTAKLDVLPGYLTGNTKALPGCPESSA